MTNNKIDEAGGVAVEAIRHRIRHLQANGMDVLRIAALSRIPAPLIDSILHDEQIQYVRSGVAGRIMELNPAVVEQEPARDVDDTVQTPATGTVRRLRSLIAGGHPRVVIAERMGVTEEVLGRIVDDPEPILVPSGIAHRASLVFNELQLIPGTDPHARHYAMERGWAPPLAWDEDELDMKNAVPAPARRTRGAGSAGARQERRRLVRELADAGATPEFIASELGVTARTVQRDLHALGLNQESVA